MQIDGRAKTTNLTDASGHDKTTQNPEFCRPKGEVHPTTGDNGPQWG
jgi:hypothetical protein